MFRKLILVAFVTTVILPFGLGCPDVGMERMAEQQAQEDDAKNYKVRAMGALNDAKNYQNRHPYDYSDQIRMFQAVITSYPDTMAAKEAQLCIQDIKNDPTYRPDR